MLSEKVGKSSPLNRSAQESDNEEKIAKHRASARKAYDSAIHFLASGALAPDQEMEITKRLAALKSGP